jgi:hypothetical protein
VRVAKQPGSRVPERQIGQLLVAVGPLADREIAAAALVALAANDRERHHDAVANLELAIDAFPTSTTSPMVSWPMMSPFFIPGITWS